MFLNRVFSHWIVLHLLWLIVCPSLAYAGSSVAWAEGFGSGSDSGNENSIAIDAQGNVYIVAAALTNNTGEIDLDPGPGATRLESDNDGIFIVKYDSNGGFLWERNPTQGFTTATAAAYSPVDDSIVAAGRLTGAVGANFVFDFPNGVLNSNSYLNGSYLWKIDAQGNHVWISGTRVLAGGTFIREIDIDDAGGIIATGFFLRIQLLTSILVLENLLLTFRPAGRVSC